MYFIYFIIYMRKSHKFAKLKGFVFCFFNWLVQVDPPPNLVGENWQKFLDLYASIYSNYFKPLWKNKFYSIHICIYFQNYQKKETYTYFCYYYYLFLWFQNLGSDNNHLLPAPMVCKTVFFVLCQKGVFNHKYKFCYL